jgi:hypothetical protein
MLVYFCSDAFDVSFTTVDGTQEMNKIEPGTWMMRRGRADTYD